MASPRCTVFANGRCLALDLDKVDTKEGLFNVLCAAAGIPYLRGHIQIWRKDELQPKPLECTPDASWCNTTEWHCVVTPFPVELAVYEGQIRWVMTIEELQKRYYRKLQEAGINPIATSVRFEALTKRITDAFRPRKKTDLPLSFFNELTGVNIPDPEEGDYNTLEEGTLLFEINALSYL